MIIWAAWPTANGPRSNEAARAWMAQGYRVAVAAELPADAMKALVGHVKVALPRYPGYYQAVNYLSAALFARMSADIVVCAGDSVLPPMHARAWQIGATFASKFPNGKGVMQPVGDRWVSSASGGSAQEGMGAAPRRMHATPASWERCESPWIGRSFALDVMGRKPFEDRYRQFFGDAELHDVAQRMGLLWKRDDIVQERIHWARPGGPSIRDYQASNFDGHYESDYGTWRARKYKGYPAEPAMAAERPRIIIPE